MQTITTAIFLLSLLTAHPVFVQSQVTINSLFTNTQSGQGTYYGATTGGNCGYGTLLPSFVSSTITQVALNTLDYVGSDLSEGCGMCIQMQGTGGGSGSDPISTTPFIAFVQDKCPSCVSGGIDIALSGDGAWDITWIAVPCPVGSSTIQYQLQGSNAYYLKLQVIGSSIPVTVVTLVIGGVNYATTRTDDNFWIPATGAPTPFVFPLTILLTAYDGSVLQDTVPSLDNSVLLSGSGVQFKTTTAPTAPTKAPTAPTTAPTAPTKAPTAPTKAPTAPTKAPTAPTKAPTAPTKAPTAPTKAPTAPTKAHSILNTLEVDSDTLQPSGAMSLSSATVAGIVIGCVGVIVVLVVVVVVIKRKPLVEEHV